MVLECIIIEPWLGTTMFLWVTLWHWMPILVLAYLMQGSTYFICIQYFAYYFQFLFNWRLSGSHLHFRPVRLVVLSDGDIFVSPTELSWKLDMARTSKPRNRISHWSLSSQASPLLEHRRFHILCKPVMPCALLNAVVRPVINGYNVIFNCHCPNMATMSRRTVSVLWHYHDDGWRALAWLLCGSDLPTCPEKP